MTLAPIQVIGGGLAGSEAAWQIASAGVPVVLHEMRPTVGTPAHQGGDLAELVCSNSFRADDWEANAVGLLHAEMRRAGSLIMAAGDANQTPAGGALAVDREGFAKAVTAALAAHPLVAIARDEVTAFPRDWDSVIVATGPLTSPALTAAILALTGEDQLSFFDAIAPIVHAETIDMGVAWRQSRYDKPGPGGDAAAYINCPMTREQYDAFVDALLAGPKSEFREWENVPYFDGCLPIEVMAERGRETLRHGPMKPVGLTNAHRPDDKPWAVVQLRQDNALGTLWNMVGFQTKLKHAAQTEVFRTIPGLERAVFARLGGLHRNTFINSPRLLDGALRLKADPTPAVRRSDHRRRGLCGERRHRIACWAAGGRRAVGGHPGPAARDNGAGRARAAHHRRTPGRGGVPADEHQLWSPAAARSTRDRQGARRKGPSAQARHGRPGLVRPRSVACACASERGRVERPSPRTPVPPQSRPVTTAPSRRNCFSSNDGARPGR